MSTTLISILAAAFITTSSFSYPIPVINADEEHAPSMRIGIVYACSPVFIRTSPDTQAPVVVPVDGEYAVVLPHDIVTYYDYSAQWVHLSSGLGFIPAQALNDDTCFVDTLPLWLTCLQQYASSVPSANQDAAHIVAAYAYYSRHYNVDVFFVLAQAFHESNVLRSLWATRYFNYAGLWVSGAKQTVQPSHGYWVRSGSLWIAGRQFNSVIDGVSEHVRIVAQYGSEQRVLSRWAVDPQYAVKVRSWQALLQQQCVNPIQ